MIINLIYCCILLKYISLLFFFSSRRRHTRSKRDWSSDVCSSDLVTYDNGNIFQHFGKTEFFKVYEIEDNKVISSEVIGSNGTGHGALAGLLADQDVDVLICGGIGGGAQTALEEAGVEMCAGAQGDADQA